MCPPLPFHQHLTRLQSFQSNFRIFVHAHTLYGDNHPTCCFGIHSIGPQGCYVHRWNGYAGLCPPAHWLYAACPKNVAFSSIFALSPAEQAPSFFTCQGLFRRPISSSGPWAPSSHPVFDFSMQFYSLFTLMLIFTHICTQCGHHHPPSSIWAILSIVWPQCHHPSAASSNNFIFSSKLQQHFDFFHVHTRLIWPSPTHQFLSTFYRILSIFATAQHLWANNPSPHRFSIDFHWVSTCLS